MLSFYYPLQKFGGFAEIECVLAVFIMSRSGRGNREAEPFMPTTPTKDDDDEDDCVSKVF